MDQLQSWERSLQGNVATVYKCLHKAGASDGRVIFSLACVTKWADAEISKSWSWSQSQPFGWLTTSPSCPKDFINSFLETQHSDCSSWRALLWPSTRQPAPCWWDCTHPYAAHAGHKSGGSALLPEEASRTAAVPRAIGAGIWNRNRSSQLWGEDASSLSYHTRKRYCIAKQLDLISQGHAARWFTACAHCRQDKLTSCLSTNMILLSTDDAAQL